MVPFSESNQNMTSAYRRLEGSFHSFDSTKIFYQGWKPNGPTKALVVITHGLGEHSESYHRLINHFAGKGYEFWAWDLRGHGRSEGIRGYASSFQNVIQDYIQFVKLILEKVGTQKPVFLLAHSMGGLVQASGLLDLDQSLFKAQVLSAPLFGVAVPVPAFKKIGAEYLEKFLPKLTLGNEINYDMLTREPEVKREFDKDALRHDRISSGMYLGSQRQIDVLVDQIHKIQIPTLFQCPEKDPVCSTEATRLASQKMDSQHVRFLEYGDGARHEMYNDTHRNEVFKDLESYFESFLKEIK